MRFSSLQNNPIMRAELAHLQVREALRLVRLRGRRGRVGKIIHGLLRLLWGGLLLVAGWFLTEGRLDHFLLYYLPAVLLLPAAIGFHFRVVYWCLALAADTLTREKQDRRWDLLLLTGVTTRRMILGKCWAVMRQMLPMYAVALVARIAVIVWLMLIAVLTTDGDKMPQAALVITALLLSVLFMFANLGFTAAVGMLASALNGSTPLNVVTGALLRVTIPLAGALFLGVLVVVIFPPLDYFVYLEWTFVLLTILGTALLSLLDNGSILALYLATLPQSSVYNMQGDYAVALLSGGLIALALYGFMTALLLWLTGRLLRRQGVIPAHEDSAEPSHGLWRLKRRKLQATE